MENLTGHVQSEKTIQISWPVQSMYALAVPFSPCCSGCRQIQAVALGYCYSGLLKKWLHTAGLWVVVWNQVQCGISFNTKRGFDAYQSHWHAIMCREGFDHAESHWVPQVSLAVMSHQHHYGFSLRVKLCTWLGQASQQLPASGCGRCLSITDNTHTITWVSLN